MTDVICNYAVLRFLPYRETEEFVNVGVVLYCPQQGYYGFRCEQRRRARVNRFFPELEPLVYKEGLRSVQAELKRMQGVLSSGYPVTDAELPQRLTQFRELVRTREGLFHFGGHGVLRATDARVGLEQLYQRFVLRQFAQQPEYRETIMRQRLDDCLREWHLRPFYKVDRPVGNERYHIKFPFVQKTAQGEVGNVIKPLDLDRRDSTEVYSHADVWLTAVRRLRQVGAAPEKVIFPVHLPAGGDAGEAADEVVRELKAEGIAVVRMEDEAALREAVAVRAA